MKSILVARKFLLELVREWQLLLLVVITPLAFLAITAIGYQTPLRNTFPVLIINHSSQGGELVNRLQEMRYEDGRFLFDVRELTDPAAAQTSLTDQSAAALVTILEDDASVTITGDALYPQFYKVSPMLENVIFDYVDQLNGRPKLFQIEEKPIFAVGPETEFDLYAPGMILFGLLMIIPQTAMLVGRESRLGTLRRLRMTGLKTAELMFGITLAQMVVAVAQVGLVFVAALALGFNNQGGVITAVIVGLVISFSAIGLGLLVACFVDNDSQAINVGSTVMMILMFLSGALYQLPPMTLFTLAGHPMGVFDVFPATHGFLALQQVLTYGLDFSNIGFRLVMTLSLSLFVFAIGIVAFQRLKMQQQ